MISSMARNERILELHQQTGTHVNKLILLYTPVFTCFMMFFSPLVLSKHVVNVLAISIAMLVLTKSIRVIDKKVALVAYLLITSIGIYAAFDHNSVYLKSMELNGMFLSFIIANYVLVRSFFERADDKLKDRFLVGFGIAFNVLAAYCLIEYKLRFNPVFSGFFSGTYTDYYSTEHLKAVMYRVSGSLQHPIVAGNFLAVGALLNYYLFEKHRNKLFLLGAVLNTAALFFTFSRSSYIALVVGALTYFLFRERDRKREGKKKALVITKGRMTAITFSALAVVLGMSFLKLDHLNIWTFIYERFINAKDEASLYQRTGGVKFVWDAMMHSNIVQFLIGHGFGGLSYDLRQENTSIYLQDFFIIDNQYFTLLYEIGLIGIIGVLTFIGFWIKKNAVVLLKKSDPLVRFGFAAVVTILVNIYFYEGLYWTSIGFLLSTVLAINSFARNKVQKSLT